jgi:hypothetical protein
LVSSPSSDLIESPPLFVKFDQKVWRNIFSSVLLFSATRLVLTFLVRSLSPSGLAFRAFNLRKKRLAFVAIDCVSRSSFNRSNSTSARSLKSSTSSIFSLEPLSNASQMLFIPEIVEPKSQYCAYQTT